MSGLESSTESCRGNSEEMRGNHISYMGKGNFSVSAGNLFALLQPISPFWVVEDNASPTSTGGQGWDSSTILTLSVQLSGTRSPGLKQLQLVQEQITISSSRAI